MPEVRRLLQELGVGMRELFPSVWIRVLEHKLAHILPLADKNIVIPDVRFDNEAAWVMSEGGLLVRVVRWNGPAWHVSATEYDNGLGDHVSERVEDLPYNALINNDGTLEDLANAVHVFMADVQQGALGWTKPRKSYDATLCSERVATLLGHS
jgi:hypothetical protein